MRNLLLVLGCLCPALAVHAHDLWLAPAPEGYVLNYGHAHSGHEGAATLEYAPDFVQRGVCGTAAGERQPLAIEAGYPARFAADCAALWVEASSGAWTTTVQGTKNLPPAGLTGVVRAWRSIESTKRIDAWHESFAAPLGDGLELVPLENPLAIEPGRKLPVLVTLGGAPVAGANVAYGGEIRGATGSDGRINLRLRAAGPQFITASVRVPSAEPGISETVHATTLHFELE